MSTPQAQFHTRAAANEGIKLPLTLPDGTATEEWLQIRSIDSDAFRAAEAASNRRLLEAMASKDRAAELDSQEERYVMLAALVAAWSFPAACTSEAVQAFLKESPQIAAEIDRVSASRRCFFKSSSSSSSSTPVQSSS
jgi:hypothetical protein